MMKTSLASEKVAAKDVAFVDQLTSWLIKGQNKKKKQKGKKLKVFKPGSPSHVHPSMYLSVSIHLPVNQVEDNVGSTHQRSKVLQQPLLLVFQHRTTIVPNQKNSNTRWVKPAELVPAAIWAYVAKCNNCGKPYMLKHVSPCQPLHHRRATQYWY